jgi:hypothetical protein
MAGKHTEVGSVIPDAASRRGVWPSPLWMRRLGLLLFAAGFYAYFLHFALDGLTSWFSHDDVMNLHGSLFRSALDPAPGKPVFRLVAASELIRDNLVLWSARQRPMGAAFYHTIYALWGFNPTPFRVTALVLVSLNLWLMFAVVRKISGSVETAIWAMFLTGVHEGFVGIYYDTGLIYDVLAFFFYYSALLYYLHLRASGKLLSTLQTLLLLGLFVAALNSKEIAVSLPFGFLLFEWFWYRPSDFRLRTLAAWFAGPLRTSLLAGLIDLIYIVGKATGAQSITNHPAYHPHLSGLLYLQNYSHYLSQLTYAHRELPAAAMLALLCGMIVASSISRQRHLKWAACMIVLAFLPLAFILPRGAAALYVPALPWALWTAGLAVALRALLARRLACCAGWLRAAFHSPRVAFRLHLATQAALAGLVILWLAPRHARAFSYVLPVVHDAQNSYRLYHDQIRMLLPLLPRGARVLVLNDPYPEGVVNAMFLISLTFPDPTMTVHLAKSARPQGLTIDPTRYDAVLDFVPNQFVLRRGPPAPHTPASRVQLQ